MNKHVPHIYNITPRNIWVFCPKLFCQHICSLTYNHDIINNSMKTHDVSLHFLKRFSVKKGHYMLYTFLYMI